MEGQIISLSYSSQSRRSPDSISILVVDDDITCLSIVAALLKRFKYEVVTVKHPNDALCTLRIKGGAFDLVISDVHMPDMDGFELQEVITHEFNLPVVLMSGDNKEGVASKGMESGAAYFISKPVSPDDLRNLWQFATKKTSQVVIEEAGKENSSSDYKMKSDEVNFSASAANDGNKDSKRKSPTKEVERRGENSAQSASKKKQKVIWTNALHNRFLEAIRSIGLDRSVPKKILEVMNVPGLTRENVASHLQKYRIFLRRVSDSSYKIHGDDKGLSRSFASSRITNFNRLTKLPFHNLGANTYTAALFPNLETSFLLKPNLRHPNHIHQSFRMNDRPSLGLVQASYQTSPLLQNASLEAPSHSFDQASILGSATSSASTNLAGQMNYVGYKISNIKHLAESGCSKENLHQKNSVNAAVLSSDNTLNLDQTARFLGHSSCYVPENTDVIPDYQNLLPLLGDLETEGLISESAFTPMNDLSEFDIMAAQQALEETDLDCYFPDIVQAQQNGGETTAGCSFNGGTNNWESHFSSYDQASNQHDDDDCLESLLAFGSFAEDDQIQTLDGI